jgi:ABC transporter substrate binding protein
VLIPASADDPVFHARVEAFLQGLQQSGWSIGRNLSIDTRWATADAVEIRRHAAELAAIAPDVSGASTVRPAMQATRTVPIVFPAVSDPVGAGFVESLARPGGNATGFMTYEYSIGGKWLQLLKEIAPRMTLWLGQRGRSGKSRKRGRTNELPPPVTPLEAKRMWDEQRRPSSRSVAKALTRAGRLVHFTTVARWKKREWQAEPRLEHPLAAVMRKVDVFVPLLTGDPTTKAVDIVGDTIRAHRQSMTEDQGPDQVIRESCIN